MTEKNRCVPFYLPLVSYRDKVDYGTRLGVIGNTGCAPKCGIHLHREVRVNGTSSTDAMRRHPGAHWYE